MYFPDQFRKAANSRMLFNSNLVKILRGEVESILNPENEIGKAIKFDGEKGILELHKPHTWNVYIQGNMEREMEVDFQKFLINVSKHSGQDVEEISTFKFYSMLEYLREESKPKPGHKRRS